MSRIGKSPISLPANVDFKFEKGKVFVKGPKGELFLRILETAITVEQEDDEIVVKRATDQKRHRSMHGLYRSLVANMIEGVTEGFKSQLELHGVGFRASNTGNLLELQLGFSHPVWFMVPAEVKVETKTEKGKPPLVLLESIDKQLLGQVTAKIRGFRPPEPYKGKGIRITGEYIRRKEGKAAAK